MSEKPHLSFSALEALWMCELRYEFARIKEIIRPPGFPIQRGRGPHKSAQRDLENKMTSGQLLNESECLDIARDAVMVGWDQDGCRLVGDQKTKNWKDVRGECVDSAVSLAKLHHRDVAPEVSPIHVERAWRVDIPQLGHDLIGYIDCQEQGRIRELKTASRAKPKGFEHTMEQLTAYALAGYVLDGEIPELTVDYLIATKEPKIDPRTTTRDMKDFEIFMRRVDLAEKKLQSGVFYPCPPGSWVCSEMWCGYTDICEFFKDRR